MTDQTLSGIGHLGLNAGLVVCTIALCSSAQAQTVTTDGSTNTSVRNNRFFSITEGTLRSGDRSTALFHSFDTFSPAQRNVIFDLRNSQNAIDTSNVNTIIGRVTGGTESFINGFLGINQDAGTPTPDLFLINPNGISFGFNAYISVPGSFVASTAESILFDQGAAFSALAPTTSAPLLTVSTPVGLQMGANPGSITNSGIVYTYGLEKTAALLGSEVFLFGGGVYAESGHIELGGIGSPSEVRLAPSASGWSFDYADVDAFSNVDLFSAVVDPNYSGSGSGSFQLVGDNISLQAGSMVGAVNRGAAPAADSGVKAQSSLLVEGYSDLDFSLPASSFLYTVTFADGDAGNLVIEAPLITLANRGQIVSQTSSTGSAGDITLRTATLEASRLQGESEGTGIFSAVSAGAEGRGGNITLEATDRVRLNNGAQIVARTFGAGDVGDITVQSRDFVAQNSLGGTSSSIESRVEQGSTGNGGNLSLNVENLSLFGGAQLSTNTYGFGNGGNTHIQAQRVEIGGGSIYSGIFAEAGTSSNGNAGNITLAANELILKDGGALRARTLGQGDAGNITIAAEDILITGASPLEEVSLISASAEVQSVGNGGDIDIRANRLTLSEGGQIVSEARNIGNAGNITLDVSDILVTGTTPSGNIRSVVTTAVTENAQGNAGNITINSDRLTLSDRGELFSAVLGRGNAGNITADTNNLIVSGGSQITTANVGEGNSGSIRIRAREQIEVSGTTPTEDYYSVISTLVTGRGNAGNVDLTAERIVVTEGGQIVSAVRGIGNGGDIILNAESILIAGTTPLENDPSLLSTTLGNNGQGEGNAGNIFITANDFQLRDGGQVLSSTRGLGNGGSITVNADNIALTGTSASETFATKIDASVASLAEGNAGNINLNTRQLAIRDGANISSSILGTGNGSNINITAEDVLVSGTSASEGRVSTIFATIDSLGQGTAGNINVDTNTLTVDQGGKILASTYGRGNAGDIILTAEDILIQGSSPSEQIQSAIGNSVETGQGDAGYIGINTRRLTLSEGGQLYSGTNSNGNGGSIEIVADDISVIGTTPSESFVSVISTGSTAAGQGNAGNIDIQTDNLNLLDGGQIFSGIGGTGNGGNIDLIAQDIVISGTSNAETYRSLIGTGVLESAQGNAGNISLVSNSLNIDRGGSISSRTAGAGNAGNLDIEATERIQIDGESASGQYTSQISADVNSTATGTGGNVNLMTERLEITQGGRVQTDTAGAGTGGNITANIGSLLIQGESSNQLRSGLTSRSSSDFAAGSLLVSARDGVVLRDGAELSVSSLFAGDAGNITLTADSLRLINDSRIDAQVAAGAQGNINLVANQRIVLDQGSKITTDATNTATGGNIRIAAPFIIGNDNSDITANAIQGDGGNVSITTEALFGLAFREQLTPANDITASSEFGLSGTVAIDLPVIDPTTGLVMLPTAVADASDQISAGCIADTGANFIATGRGGIPTDPAQGVMESVLLQSFDLTPQGSFSDDFAALTDATTETAVATTLPASQPVSPATDQIVEASSWDYNDRGEVTFVTQTKSAVTSPHHTVSSCLGGAVS